jgi:two-component system sensor histidine kinase YesM
MRFEDRLNYEINIDCEGALNCNLPKLCLLPIVENAVIHGLESKRDGGKITIEVTCTGEKVLIKVTDDGRGFDTGTLDIENVSPGAGGETHIGLYNTNKRIRLMFGAEYGLSIKSVIGCGTEVTVCIPWSERGDFNVPRNDS